MAGVVMGPLVPDRLDREGRKGERRIENREPVAQRPRDSLRERGDGIGLADDGRRGDEMRDRDRHPAAEAEFVSKVRKLAADVAARDLLQHVMSSS